MIKMQSNYSTCYLITKHSKLHFIQNMKQAQRNTGMRESMCESTTVTPPLLRQHFTPKDTDK